MIPLPFSRRDKCKKTNIAQCMLHEQQTYFARVFPVWKKSRATRAVVVLGFVFLFFKHSTWRRPTPLRLRATSGCN